MNDKLNTAVLCDLSGKRVMVTGASSGIGRAVAVLISGLGAEVALVGRDEGRLRETAGLLPGGAFEVLPFDLAQPDVIPGWMAGHAAQQGPFAGVAHCAGEQLVAPLRFLSPKDMNKLMNINITSCVALAKGFRQRNAHCVPGSVVFVSSVLGMVGAGARVAYSATKGAVIALTRSLALELAGEQIRVNCVSPGFVRTPMLQSLADTAGTEALKRIEAMHPLGFGEPRDVACAVAFLLAESARWITGTNLVVDGGYTAG